ncbi:zinc transport system substrate-binding protein [Sediminihabitans luteus]|uniref:Zinc transport system substrate-binding protein n=1 Tax=Sediminihabitans luteus TaxID=1138585 RepID=A0A2M9CPV7_9CELL|nr:metal ABC transporter substrate-binding protein [Sediminihabitans luteus]PJJ73947.1 zinc transport system substrate-binding protein [Sediminihabitans luteus]GII98140.1 zinc ABC transporter substrate-binding protein [Sediminihabitans luteus]
MPLPRRALLTAATVSAVALTAAACGTASVEAEHPDRVQVLASFYPLQFVAERIGGEHVDVSNLTPPAAEPHDLELSPAQVRRVGDADLVIYLAGFQEAVDEAVEARDANALDAADSARLEAEPDGTDASEHDEGLVDEHAHESEEEHAEHADDGHDHGILDPHFWLDPTRLADVATAVEASLADVDPEHAADYSANLEALLADLGALDDDYTAALEPCTGAALVTSHEAFGYLAERYDLDQVGIAGVDPQNEPSPARLREIREVVEERDVSTVYTEVSASTKVAETFAQDVGVDTAVLDPIETLTDDSTDYLGIMRTNLDALETGLTCP